MIDYTNYVKDDGMDSFEIGRDFGYREGWNDCIPEMMKKLAELRLADLGIALADGREVVFLDDLEAVLVDEL